MGETYQSSGVIVHIGVANSRDASFSLSSCQTSFEKPRSSRAGVDGLARVRQAGRGGCRGGIGPLTDGSSNQMVQSWLSVEYVASSGWIVYVNLVESTGRKCRVGNIGGLAFLKTKEMIHPQHQFNFLSGLRKGSL